MAYNCKLYIYSRYNIGSDHYLISCGDSEEVINIFNGVEQSILINILNLI